MSDETKDYVDVEFSIMDLITDESVWQEYIDRKNHISSNERLVKCFEKIITSDEFIDCVNEISNESYELSLPVKKMISKYKVGKKRVVYTYNDVEMAALRVIAHLLYRYDYIFSENLYSFRRSLSVKDAIKKISHDHRIVEKYGYKIDVHNYFNSIPPEELLKMSKEKIPDGRLNVFIEKIYLSDKSKFNGEIISELKGVMAGIPIAPFFSNLYLSDMDEYFLSEGCDYFRYADDIIIFSDSLEEIEASKNKLISKINSKHLEINPKKEKYFKPGDQIEFLGFSIVGGEIDISSNTIYKMKGKIRRSARSIRRWMLKKNAPIEGTIRAFLRRYNEKFYGCGEDELSWALWYFPTITTFDSLHTIDVYLQEWARYIATGKHNKLNYEAVPYELLKELGYRPLVSEYRRFKDGDYISDSP